MKTTYDPEVDALSLRFTSTRGSRPRTLTVRPGIHLDFSADGKLVALEVLDASTHFAPAMLAAIGRPSTPMTLEELEAETGLASATWRQLLSRKRVQGKKVGGTWTIEFADALKYMESRAATGRQPVKRKARQQRRRGAGSA